VAARRVRVVVVVAAAAAAAVVVATAPAARTTAVGHVVGDVREDGPREPFARVPVRDAPEETAETVVRARQPVHRHEERRGHRRHSVQLARVQGECELHESSIIRLRTLSPRNASYAIAFRSIGRRALTTSFRVPVLFAIDVFA